MKQRSSHAAPSTWIWLGVIAVAGLWPYADVLRLWPVSRDATLWIARSAPVAEGWSEWVFATRHFGVGYRPATALSYTLDYLAGGFSAVPYRLTDLAIHSLNVALVFALFRRLARSLPSWCGLLAAAVFAAHPLAAEVVPHLARRSYSLATMLGLLSLVALVRSSDGVLPGRGPRRLASGLGGLAMFAAALANEAAYLTAIMAPLLVLSVLPPGRASLKRTLSACGPMFAFVALALALRLFVVGGVGGYAADAHRLERLVPIALATWRALGMANPGSASASAVSPALVLLASAVALYYVARVVRDRISAVEVCATTRTAAVLVLWIVGYGLLFAPMGVWFPRQVYPALVPFSLLVAVVIAATVRRYAGVRFLFHAAPQLLLLGWLVFHSPLWRGSDPVRVQAWSRTDAMLRDLHAELGDTPEPSLVRLVLPDYVRPEPFAFRARDRAGLPSLSSRQPELWMRALVGNREIQVATLAVFREHPLEAALPPTLHVTDSGRGIVLSADRPYVLLDHSVSARSLDGAYAIELPSSDTRGAFVYFHDGRRGIRVPVERG